MKKILIIVCCAFISVNVYSQKDKSLITPAMAKKVSSWCQRSSSSALRLCYQCLQTKYNLSLSNADRAISSLDKHLDYAEEIIYAIYLFQPDWFRLTVKDYFTINEIDIMEKYAEKRYEKEKQEQQRKEQQIKERKEKELQQKINEGYVFMPKELSQLYQVHLNIDDQTLLAKLQMSNNVSFNCIINKDGQLLLKNIADSIKFSESENNLFQYLQNEGSFTPGHIGIFGKNTPVNAEVTIRFYIVYSVTQPPIILELDKSKKGDWTEVKKQTIPSFIESALYSCPTFLNLDKGRWTLKATMSMGTMSLSINGKVTNEVPMLLKFYLAYKKGKAYSKNEFVDVECEQSIVIVYKKSKFIGDDEIMEEDAKVVEEKPKFMGGDENEFTKWVYRNMRIPEIAKENNIQGRVICSFVVAADGKVVDVKVLRGVDPSLDVEAFRVISMSPKWTPGKQGGKPVRVKYTFPVIFQLR